MKRREQKGQRGGHASFDRRREGDKDARDTERRRPPAPRAFREEEGQGASWTKIYGVSPVLEALRAGERAIEQVIVAEGAQHFRLRELLSKARERGVPVRRAPRAELQRMAGAEANHQGVMATIAAALYADKDELLESLVRRIGSDESPLAVVLDGVEDPRNLGAILRTVECAGAHGVFIPERRAVGLTETVAKAAAGALERVRVARVQNLARLLEELKERNIWTVGTSADAELDYTEWDWTVPCALVFGGEGAGLHRLVRERCDTLVRIPVRGHITSLNVSVAAGVVLYEALRQRAKNSAEGERYVLSEMRNAEHG
ncbi:MAG TPA: 23S rRNA (guanosine(2251)-2'-O)-methyltransferase RlmB [Pyrinomonadaceae bacterium]|nr:23S rRNA (guanosine(2251)-2'-O)-methyltransferase RlmB [Pyrinomonadaceae bacterium]